jgi:phosphoenolpyruvate---glycerone phosphotransferase subunit DhaL
MLTAAGIIAGVRRISTGVGEMRDVLNAADRRFGDGDTGMTIEHVVAAWQGIDADAARDAGSMLVALGRATSQASGSSLGAVLATALGAAGRATRGRTGLTRADIVAALGAARETVSSRSGASSGDKTVLDSLVAIEQALATASDADDLHDIALCAAENALATFRERESRIGRARMYGPKSAGSDDPGMLAAVLLLRGAR